MNYMILIAGSMIRSIGYSRMTTCCDFDIYVSPYKWQINEFTSMHY
jgi:hypothetical protein